MKKKIFSKFKSILEGWTNHMFRKTSPEAKKRLSICKGCEKMTKVQTCSVCGCYIPAKVKSTKEKCPLKKW